MFLRSMHKQKLSAMNSYHLYVTKIIFFQRVLHNRLHFNSLAWHCGLRRKLNLELAISTNVALLLQLFYLSIKNMMMQDVIFSSILEYNHNRNAIISEYQEVHTISQSNDMLLKPISFLSHIRHKDLKSIRSTWIER